jgi:hypothetical protein
MAKKAKRRLSPAMGEGASDHLETNLLRKENRAGMDEREYKDFLRDGPAFFVYANTFEFRVFHGFLT